MLSNYEKAVELIKSREDLINFSDTCKPSNTKSIENAEKLLNVKLPYSYRRFINEFGVLYFGGSSIEGINDSDLSKSDMIDWTLDERNNWEMPKNLVIIEDEGLDGERYCLQINEKDPDKSPVVVYVSPEVPIEVLAPDFGTYFLQWVQQEIEYQRNERKKE